MKNIKNTGLNGERLALKFIKSNILGCKLMQLDWVLVYNNSVIIFEIKTQEKYTNPNGHGLPSYQIDARLKLSKLFKKKARVFLLVVCLTDVCIYTMELDKNWSKKGFYTKTKKRFIFYIEEFKKHNVLKFDIEKIIKEHSK